VTQEKLDERLMEFCDKAGTPCTSGHPHEIHELAINFAKSELQKAAEIAHNAIGATRHEIADEIRKLMD
jgi:hypothetical protein